MSRAFEICENIKRQTGRTVYRCMNNNCQHFEVSTDMTPKDMFQGNATACSKCGGMTEAVWGGNVAGSINQPLSTRVNR